ncbi:MAG: hypothetical protein IPM34_08940 [Saprospiraceae bacterium]|nr:hypothetical protein [Saprospiraceae bacterium]
MQQLIDSGALIKANQTSKNSWNYCLRYDGMLTDCEIKYNQKSLKQVVCACGFRGSKRLCKHSQIIVYWHLLKIYRRSAGPANEFSEFKENDLQKLSAEELRFYLKALMRNNPKAQKWVELLHAMGTCREMDIHSMFQACQNFSVFLNDLHKNQVSREKNLLQLSNDLYNTSLRFYSLSEVNRACSIMIAAIQLLYTQIQTRKVINTQKFHQAIIKYTDALNQILTAIIAPQALNSFLRHLIEFSKSDAYYPAHKECNLFNSIRNRIKNKSIEKELVASLQNKCLESIHHPFAFYTWDVYYQTDALGFLKFLKSPVFARKNAFPNILNFLGTRNKQLEQSFYLELLRYILPNLNRDLQILAATYLNAMHIQMSSLEDKQLFIQLYLVSKNQNLLTQYFSSEGSVDKLYDIAQQMLEKAQLPIEESLEIELELLFYSQQYQSLTDKLMAQESIDLIMKYDANLPAQAKTRLIKSYGIYLTNFKLNNIGPKATRRIKQITSHLMAHYSKEHKLFKNLHEYPVE